MSKYGYNFYFKDGSDVLTFPITPGELSIKTGSNNKVITLIGEGDVNILKSPSLVEVEFDARFPMRQYPYSREVGDFQTYFDKFKELKEDKKSFRFIVARTTPNGNRTWDTNLLMALEDITFNESADEGDDVIVSFKLKQYKEYGVKIVQTVTDTPDTTSTSDTPRGTDNKASEAEVYTVKPGDCLWNIAKAAYGNGAKYTVIYEANKNIIEETAKKNRNGKGSSNGHWIYPGTKLTIPNVDDAAVIAQKMSNSASNNTKKQTVTIAITSKHNKTGDVTVSYISDGVKKYVNKKDLGTITVNVDSWTEVRVGIHPMTATSYVINSEWGLWSSSKYLYTISRIWEKSSLAIEWI